MTPAELRILINVRAAEARRLLGKMNGALAALDSAGTKANVTMSRFNGVVASSVAPLNNSSAAAANLAKALTSMSRGGSGKSLGAAATAAGKMSANFAVANKEAQYLAVSLSQLSTAGTRAATGLIAASTAAKGLGATAAAANKAASASAAAGGAAAGAGKKASTAGKEIQRYGSATGSAVASTSRLATASSALTVATNGVANSQTNAQRAGSRTYSTLDRTATSTRGLAGASDQAGRTSRNFTQRLGEMSTAARKNGSQMQWAGRQISMMFTAPVALGIGLGTKWLLDLQKQQTQLAKVYDDGSKSAGQFKAELSELYNYFKLLSNQTGISQEEVTEIGAAWAQAGKKGAALAKYTQLTAEAMIVGDITADQAATSMQALSLQWGIGTKKSQTARGEMLDMTDAVANLNQASNITQVSYGDLIEAMSKTGATARGVGLTFKETTAIMTTLVKITGSAATAGNGVKSILSRLLSPTKEAKKAMLELGDATGNVSSEQQALAISGSDDVMKKMGIDADDATWRMKPAAERLKEIAGRYADLDAQSQADFAKPFAGLFQIDKFRQIMADLANEQGNYNKVMDQTADGTNNLAQYQSELQKFLESNPQKMKIAGAVIKNSLMDVVIVLLPYIVRLAQMIAKMAQSFANLNPHVQKVILGLLLFLALVGPLVMLIASFKVLFGVLGSGLVGMIKGFGAVGGAVAKGYGALAFWRKGAQQAGTDSATAGARIRAGFARGFTAAAESARAGSARAAAGWRAGMNDMPRATAQAGAAATAAQARNNATFMATTRMGAGEAAAAHRMGQNRIVSTIYASGPAQATAQRRNMAAQAAAVRTGGAGVVAAQRQVGTAQAAAAGTGGAAAGRAGAEGTKRGFKGRIGGLAGIVLMALSFLPASFFKKGWDAAKSLGSGLIKGIKAAFGALKGAVSSKGTEAMNGSFKGLKWANLLKLGGITAVIGLLIEAFIKGAGNIKSIITKTLGGDGGSIPILARPFVLSARLIVNVMKQLPSVIASTMRGIVSLIQNAAKAVYKAFSYMNPFAHHSPSLVENVTKGMAVVTNRFADASGAIQAEMRGAYAAIKQFGSATAGLDLNVKASQIEREDTRAPIAQADPSGAALRAYDQLDASVQRLTKHQEKLSRAISKQEGVIAGLKNKLDAADKAIEGLEATMTVLQKTADATSKALEKAQTQLDYFANAPIKGMRAMSDAIFENEMAQKKLRLEIMKMEDAGESVDDVTSKFEALQGQIENLSGQRRELQLGGAGSDILGTYDKMIADLKAQQATTADGHVNEITALNKSLDELARKGEMLDLENSLKFDPLTRQIDQLVNSEKELDFATIRAGVTSYKTQVEGLTIANNAANAAIEMQQARIDGATMARDALSKTIEGEEGKLTLLNETYSQVGDAIDTANSSMEQITSSAGTVNQRIEEQRQALEDQQKAMEDAAQAAEDNKDALDGTADAVDGLGDSLEDLSAGGGFEVPPIDSQDLDESIEDLSKDIQSKIEGMFDGISFSGIGSKIGGFFSGLWSNTIWPAIKEWVPKIVDFLMSLPNELMKFQIYFVGFMIGLAAKIIVAFIVGLGKLGAKIGEIFVSAIEAIPGLLSSAIGKVNDFFHYVFSGELFIDLFNWVKDPANWAQLGKDIWNGFVGGIKAMFGGIWNWIKGNIIDPFINGIKDGFGIASPSTVMFDIAVNIIQGLYNGLISLVGIVLQFFMDLPMNIISAIGDLAGMIGGLFSNIWTFLIENLPIGAVAVYEWFAGLPAWLVGAIGDLGSTIGGLFSGAWNFITENLPIWCLNATLWFSELPGRIVGWIGDLGGMIGNVFSGAWNFIVDNMPGWAMRVYDWFGNLPGQIGEKLGNLWEFISKPFTNAFDTVWNKLVDWKDKIVGIFQDIPGAIGKGLGFIQDKVKTPINWVIDKVYNNGIRKIWNNTAGKVGLPDMGEIQELAVGGTVAGKAIGGRISGPGTGTSDSILTTAKAGSEIFTAREVANAGGFGGLEKLLAGKGVGRGNHAGGQQVPVKLSNGEYRLDPSQVAALGGTNAVRALRGRLAAGQMAGHFPGGDIIDKVVDVAKDPVGAVKDAGRKAASIAVDKALGLLGKTIPEVLTPPGGEVGQIPKEFFNTVRGKMVDAIAGDEKIQGKAGKLPTPKRTGGIVRLATGGPVPAAAPATGGPAAAPVAPTGAPEVGGDAATGAGLVESVTAATQAAQAIWDDYYVSTAAAKLAADTAEQTAQLTHDTSMLLERQTAADQAVLINTNTNLAIETANATHRAFELAADLVWQQTMTAQTLAWQATTLTNQNTWQAATIASDTTFKATLLANQQTFAQQMLDSWTGMRNNLLPITQGIRDDTTLAFNEMSNNLNQIVSGPITDTMNTFDPLLRAVVGWFDTAANDVGTMWDKTKEGTAAPSRFIINDVYNTGIRGAWSQVHTWLDLPELGAFTAGFAEGGMVGVDTLSNPNNPKNVKNGGPLKATSASRDSTLFAGLRGEYVLNKDQVRQWGGISQLEGWRKNALAGTKPMEGGGQFTVPGFASGGALKPMGDQDVVPGVIQEVPKQLAPYKGRAYDYGGGGGAGGYDCSGWTGAVHKILLGQSPVGRIWDTEVNFGSYGYQKGKEGYWSMGVHNGGGGMSSHTAGTLAGVNYESGGAHNTSTWGGPAAGTVNPQFENQYFLPELGGKFVGNAGGSSYQPIEPMLLEMWDKAVQPTKDAAGVFPGGGTAGNYPEKGFDKFNLLRGVVQKKAAEKDKEAREAAAAAMASAGQAGDGVERWRPVVQDVLRRTGNPLNWDELTLMQMQTESGGNPAAINLDDDNAKRGTPSKGLMQVIDPTFASYRDPQFPNDIWDPHANIAAGLNWAKTKGGPPAVWGNGIGYDSGGWLAPGVTTAVNQTGTPEAILTTADWNAIYAAANNPVDVEMLSDGVYDAFQTVFGYQPQNALENSMTSATEVALAGQNKTWTPALLGDTESVVDNTAKTIDAAKGTTKAVSILDDNMKTQMANLSDLMGSISSAASSYDPETGVTFALISPVLNSLASMIEGLPMAEASYVPWAGTNQVVTDAMAQEKKLNDIKNLGKGLYNATIKMAPILLKHTATIGTAVEQLVQQDAAAWAQGIALLSTGNPMGAMILVPILIKEILTILPLVIQAIMDIVPALIETIIMFMTQFMPDSVYAYDTYDAAQEAATKNQAAIRQGASAPYFTVPVSDSVQQGQSNETVIYNTFTGDISLPNVTNESGAQTLADNLSNLAST